MSNRDALTHLRAGRVSDRTRTADLCFAASGFTLYEVARYLRHVGLPSELPHIASPRAPPQVEMEFCEE